MVKRCLTVLAWQKLPASARVASFRLIRLPFPVGNYVLAVTEPRHLVRGPDLKLRSGPRVVVERSDPENHIIFFLPLCDELRPASRAEIAQLSRR